MVKLNQLANALALQEFGSFRRAAETQHISQPAFSRSIQQLENSLGVILFDRQTTGIKPTIYGEALLKRAGTMLLEADEIVRETRLLKEFNIGSLSMAMGFYAAELSGSKAIAEMVRLHPELRFQIEVGDWCDVEKMVLDRLVDIGFAGTYHIKGSTPLQIEPVAEHDFVFYCRSGHPLLERKNLTKTDLDAYPTVAIRVPPQMTDIFPGKSYLDEKNGNITPSIKAGDQTAARVIVAGSDAFSAVAPVQIEPWLRSEEFKILDFRESWMKIDYGFIYREDRILAPAAEAFMQHVREIETEVTQRNKSLIKELFPATGKDRKD